MREFSTPLTTAVPATGNLTDDVVRNAAEAPDAVVFSRRPKGSETWDDVTAAAFHAEVRGVAKGLLAAGVEAGDRVALISRTRYEWTLLDYAIWYAGAVGVPIYETSSPEQVRWILLDSGACAVVAEGPSHLTRIAEVRADLEDLRHVWSIEDNAVDVLTRLGADISDDALETRRRAATPLDLATIIYTSGTTGPPKGCMITHGNLMTEVGVAVEELGELFSPDDSATLLFLPLAHVFARVIQVGAVKARVRPAAAPTSPTWFATSASSSRHSSWRCPASSRRRSIISRRSGSISWQDAVRPGRPGRRTESSWSKAVSV